MKIRDSIEIKSVGSPVERANIVIDRNFDVTKVQGVLFYIQNKIYGNTKHKEKSVNKKLEFRHILA